MDEEDQDEIIKKVKTSGIGDEPSGEDTEELTGLGDEEPMGDEGGFDGGEEDIEENIFDGGENPMDAMYVEYMKPYSDETPFNLHTPDGVRKFEYCWATYPNGKRDIAVYSYAGDVTYGYRWFRKAFLNDKDLVENLKKTKKSTIFEGKIKDIIMNRLNETFNLDAIVDETMMEPVGTDTDTEKEQETITKPDTKEAPTPTRETKTWGPSKPNESEDPRPKAYKIDGQPINIDSLQFDRNSDVDFTLVYGEFETGEELNPMQLDALGDALPDDLVSDLVWRR